MEDKIKIVVEEVKDVPIEEAPKAVEIPVEPISIPEKKKFTVNKGIILVAFFAVLLITLLVGGIIVSRDSLSRKEAASKKSVITVLSPVPTTEVSPTPTIDISSLKISILNGSGVSGKANEIKKYLEGLGYENITTGNAKTFDYKNLTLSLKSDKNEFLDRLKTDIAKKYTLNEESLAVETSNTSDVVIIVGK